MTRTYEEMGFSKETCAILNEIKSRTFVDVVKGEVYTNTMLRDIIFRFNAERAVHKFKVVSCKKVAGFEYQGTLTFNGETYTFECKNCMDLIDLKYDTKPELLLKCIKGINIKERCDGATKTRLALFLSRYF